MITIAHSAHFVSYGSDKEQSLHRVTRPDQTDQLAKSLNHEQIEEDRSDRTSPDTAILSTFGFFNFEILT